MTSQMLMIIILERKDHSCGNYSSSTFQDMQMLKRKNHLIYSDTFVLETKVTGTLEFPYLLPSG